jgi:hypothetical protein
VFFSGTGDKPWNPTVAGPCGDRQNPPVIPRHVTHYYEADHGPFLNICDLPEERAARLLHAEKDAPTAFNRFAMGDAFLRWRREADDLLIRAYAGKFGRPPEGRPYYALLGSFDRTLSMFREGRKLELDVGDFADFELTFMYPDHAHLLSLYGSEVPRLFYDLPPDESYQGFRGRLFTLAELDSDHRDSGIEAMVEEHRRHDRWAGSYVEAHLWRRNLRAQWCQTAE